LFDYDPKNKVTKQYADAIEEIIAAVEEKGE
jgi:hypothetical protein